MVALALGTVQFGMAYGVAGADRAIDPAEAREILKVAREGGIHRLDTAPGYGDIEARLMDLAGDLDFEIVSKIPALPKDATAVEALAASVERSRARLGSRLVGLLFHESEDVAEMWLPAASLAREAGLRLGGSYYVPAEAAVHASTLPDLAMVQVPANAFDQRLSCHQYGSAEVTVRSAFLQGLLLMDFAAAARRVPAATTPLDNWRHWCAARGMSALEGALGLVKACPADYVVVGVDGLEHFRQLLVAWDRTSPINAGELAVEALDVIDPRQWGKP